MNTTPTGPLALARAAGFFYLVIIVAGIAGAAFLREPLVVAGDPAATAANVAASELVFRISILADVVMALADVALAALLFFLLRPVSEVLSLMAMAFRLVQASVLGLNLLNLHSAAGLLSTSVASRDAWLAHLVGAHAAGYDIGLFFFGINCLLVGFLVMRASFLPRVLGGLLAAAGVVYLAGSTVHVLAPSLVPAIAPAYGIPVIAELAFCVWFMVRGVDAAAWSAAGPKAPAADPAPV